MFDLLDAIGLDYRRLPRWLIRLSYLTCSRRTGSPESWCSYVYATDQRGWVLALGRMHCAACYHWHRRRGQ